MKKKSRLAILIPGIFDPGTSMIRMQRALEAQGFAAHYLHLRYNSGWRGMEHLSEQLGSRVDALLRGDDTCALVGFSMGGIVARHYLQTLGGLDRVHKFIAISSPHFGSYWASLLPYRGGRQLCVGSEFLLNLNRDVEPLCHTEPVSVWTPYDATIVPHHSALLPVGSSYEVPVKLHRWMPASERVISIVSAELARALRQPV